MCPPAIALRSHSRRRCYSPTLLSMNDCGSFCHASTIVRFKSELFGGHGHMQTRFYAGARGPGPQFVAAPDFWRFSRFYHRHSVCDDRKRPRGQAPRILGLEPRMAICLAQWTARSHAARNAVRYYRNHSLDGATLFSKLGSNKLRFNIKNEMTLICAKFHADLINISKLTSRKTKWLRFFGLPVGQWRHHAGRRILVTGT